MLEWTDTRLVTPRLAIRKPNAIHRVDGAARVPSSPASTGRCGGLIDARLMRCLVRARNAWLQVHEHVLVLSDWRTEHSVSNGLANGPRRPLVGWDHSRVTLL
jgi:hypothetical protein